MIPPDMPPEVFVSLRLLGLTTGGMCEIAHVHPEYPFERLVKAWEAQSEARRQACIAYWNSMADDRRRFFGSDD